MIIIIGFTSIIVHTFRTKENWITNLFTKSLKIQFRAILLCLHSRRVDMPKKAICLLWNRSKTLSWPVDVQAEFM